MTKPAPHLRRDAQRLAYDRTIEGINRVCDVYGRDPEILSAVASASMNAAFLMLYCATRLEHGQVPPPLLYKIWGEAMSQEFSHMEKGFNIASDLTQNPTAKGHA